MDLLEIIKNELTQQSDAIKMAIAKIDNQIEEAVKIIYDCQGKVIVTGMGKTGLIGRKVAGTLASTGTMATFLHAAEGIHGDLGIIHEDDVIIAISNSGNTAELVSIIPFFKLNKNKIIALTGNLESKLAQNSDYVVDCSVPKDYEKFGLVPTASTTVALAMGDAIAVALMKLRNFQISDYAQFHPGGSIGKKILLTVDDLMHSEERNPKINIKSDMKHVIMEMTSKGLGCANIIDDENNLLGIVTDGDLRRLLHLEKDIYQTPISEAMTKNPKRMKKGTLAIDALNLMEDNKITMLPIVDENDKTVGLLHMHDLIDAGIV